MNLAQCNKFRSDNDLSTEERACPGVRSALTDAVVLETFRTQFGVTKRVHCAYSVTM